MFKKKINQRARETCTVIIIAKTETHIVGFEKKI